jgi:hypothetical protein
MVLLVHRAALTENARIGGGFRHGDIPAGVRISGWQGCQRRPQMRGFRAGKVANAAMVRLSIDTARTQPYDPSARGDACGVTFPPGHPKLREIE